MMSFISKIISYIPFSPSEEVTEESIDVEAETQTSLYTALMNGLSAGADHLSALSSLFLVEVGEAGERLRSKFVLLIVAAFVLVVGYLFTCVTLTILLATWIGWLYSALAMALLHLVIGGIALIVGVKRKVGPIAPQTVQELQVDYQCLKIATQESKNF
jgi:hypothetical protein